MLQTYAPAKISEKRTMTPEGFMLIRDVRLARIGDMLYSAGQTPIPPGPSGVTVISRDADVVFAQETLDSFVGKPITVLHPTGNKVGPENFREVAGGHILSVRRGSPPEQDFMVGDVLATTPESIALADKGCEVSCGYAGSYVQTGPGRGRQTKIVGNHLAFLPDGIKGRCGPECYVGDQSMDIEEPTMTTAAPKNPSLALLSKLFGAKDDAEGQAILSQATADAAAVEQNAALDAKFDAFKTEMTAIIADAVKDLVPAKEVPAEKTALVGDAAALQAAHTSIAAAAEILSPGYVIPTFDAAGDMTATADSLCACQKEVLTKAYATPEGEQAIKPLLAGKVIGEVKGMTADATAALFFGASALAAQMNNTGILAAASAAAVHAEYHTQAERSAAAQKRSDDRWSHTRTSAAGVKH